MVIYLRQYTLGWYIIVIHIIISQSYNLLNLYVSKCGIPMMSTRIWVSLSTLVEERSLSLFLKLHQSCLVGPQTSGWFSGLLLFISSSAEIIGVNYLIWFKKIETQGVGLAWQVCYPLRRHPGPVMISPKATLWDEGRKTIDKDRMLAWKRNYLL